MIFSNNIILTNINIYFFILIKKFATYIYVIKENLTTHNCISCSISYYLIETINGKCISSLEQKNDYPSFYLDISDSSKKTYRQCYSTCHTCNEKGNLEKHYCTSCKGDLVLINIDFGILNCVNKNILNDDYFLIDGIYVKCYKTCKKCSTLGNEKINMSTECKEGYSFIAKKQTNCILKETQPDNYILNEKNNTYIQCHKNCKKCFEIGNDEINKCINCIDGLEYTTGNKLGNCKNLNEINIDIDEIKQFIPIINKSDDIEIKSLLLNNNYKFEYYIPIINGELDSSMIFSQNLIPHIELTEECKNKLELNKQNIIYIGQIIYSIY